MGTLGFGSARERKYEVFWCARDSRSDRRLVGHVFGVSKGEKGKSGVTFECNGASTHEMPLEAHICERSCIHGFARHFDATAFHMHTIDS